jgi:lipopolysaccharide biosynthesis glycosyltransferase
MTALKVYVGYDQREHAAYEVCRHSLIRRSSLPVDCRPLTIDGLRRQGWYSREHYLVNGQRFDFQDKKPFSTDFSFSRFLVPALENYQGWALFLDCDFLIRGDIAQLFEDADKDKAVLCVKHHHEPEEGLKMDGVLQTRYRRKNWSSLVLWNCGHPSNRRLTVENANTRPGAWLHAFEWLEEHEIGMLPADWNFLVGWDKLPYNEVPRGLHYTSGGPWFSDTQDVPYADLWLREREHREYAIGRKPSPKDSGIPAYYGEAA